MAVVFKSVIKIDDKGDWYIELTDTTDNRVEICCTLDEYSQKVEELGVDYGGNIDEVKWSKADNVSLLIMDEIRLGMSKYQEELEKNDSKTNSN